LLIKGRSWVDERAEARHQGQLKNLDLRKAAVYAMPPLEEGGAEGESTILRITRRDAASHDDDE